LSKVGIPGEPVGMNENIVTIAALLKEQGYATGQFGKNLLGDLNHMLPTNHGFDEFFGNLYHLNAEEDPEMDNYPSKKEFPKFFDTFGPRGVIHSWATDTDDRYRDDPYRVQVYYQVVLIIHMLNIILHKLVKPY
jgi:arylsulfatase A-like enzyme